MRFDLSAVPAGATVVSASMTLHVAQVTSPQSPPVHVHRITAAWDELSVTHDSFQQAFSTEEESSFVPKVGPAAMNVQPIVQGWVSGSYPNHGLLLKRNAASTRV